MKEENSNESKSIIILVEDRKMVKFNIFIRPSVRPSISKGVDFPSFYDSFFFARCSSMVGKRYAEPGRQTISIGNGCNNVGTIIHEMMHAVG